MINKTDVGTKFDLVLSALIWRALVNNFDILHQKESFFDSNDFQIQVSPSNHFVISHPMSVIPPPPSLSCSFQSKIPAFFPATIRSLLRELRPMSNSNFPIIFIIPFQSLLFPNSASFQLCITWTDAVMGQKFLLRALNPIPNSHFPIIFFIIFSHTVRFPLSPIVDYHRSLSILFS